MSPSDALYRAVCAAPHDDLPRLVFADWLEENGRSERAEFIRVQCRLANASPADADYVDLLEREAELKAILWRELDADRPALPPGIGWEPEHRGFAERLRFGHMLQPDAVTRLEGCSAGVPISGLTLGQLSGQSLDLLTGAYRTTLTSVEFTLGSVAERPSPGVTLIASGALPNLRRMVVDFYASSEGIGELATSDALRNLRAVSLPEFSQRQPAGRFSWSGSVESLRIQRALIQFRDGLPNLHTLNIGRLTDADADLFSRPDALPRLAALSTQLNEPPRPPRPGSRSERPPADDDRLHALALLRTRNRPLSVLRLVAHHAGNEMERLFAEPWVEHLRITEVRARVAQVGPLFRSPHLGRLRQLWVTCTGDGLLSQKEVVASVCWASLTTFDGPGCPLGQTGGYGLLRHVEAPNLKHLNLKGVPLGDAGAVALAENASLANLTRLNLSACRIGSRGVEALVNSPHLQRLIELNLYANNGGEALAPLADPGVLPNLGLADVAANGVSDELRSRLEQRSAIRAR